MGTLLYLHGLASSPKGRKAELLAKRFGPEGFRIVAPDLNVPSFERLRFEAIVEEAVRAEEDCKPDVVIGSSLGALVALSLARRAGAASPPLVLVAPALAFGDRWTRKLAEEERIELFHFGEGKPLPIHREFFEGMASVAVEDDPPPVPVSVVMGTADESIPFDQVEATWKRWEASGKLPAGSRFHRVDGGDHGLVEHGDAIEAAIRERLTRVPAPPA